MIPRLTPTQTAALADVHAGKPVAPRIMDALISKGVAFEVEPEYMGEGMHRYMLNETGRILAGVEEGYIVRYVRVVERITALVNEESLRWYQDAWHAGIRVTSYKRYVRPTA